MIFLKELTQIFLGEKERGIPQVQLIRGTVETFILRVTSIGFAFATSFILARILGAKGYGIYAYTTSWVSLLCIPSVMGLDTLLTREVARYKTLSDWHSLRGLLSLSDKIGLFASLGFALTGAIVIWLVKSHLERQMVDTFWIGMTILPFLTLTRLRQGSIQGLGCIIEAQIPLMLILPFLFIILILIMHFGFRLTAPLAVGMQAIAAGCAFFSSNILLKRHLPSFTKGTCPEHHYIWIWLHSGFVLLLAQAAWTINDQISTVIIGSIIGPESAGIFDIARRMAMIISFVLMTVNVPLAPTVASLHVRGERKCLQQLVTKSVRLALFGSLPVAFVLVIFRHRVLSLFGNDFIGGSTTLAILSIGQLINVGIGSVGLLLNMTGGERHTAWGTGIATVVNVILNFILIPIWGIEGAAVANTISIATWNILLAMLVYKTLNIHPTAFGPLKLKREG